MERPDELQLVGERKQTREFSRTSPNIYRLEDKTRMLRFWCTVIAIASHWKLSGELVCVDILRLTWLLGKTDAARWSRRLLYMFIVANIERIWESPGLVISVIGYNLYINGQVQDLVDDGVREQGNPHNYPKRTFKIV